MMIIDPYRLAAEGGGGGGTVTTFFPLDTANGYANLGTLDVGDATPTGTGTINSEYTANRSESYNSQDASDELVIDAGSFPDCGTDDWCMEMWIGALVDGSTNTLFSGDQGSSGNPDLIFIDYNGASQVRAVVKDSSNNQSTLVGTPAHTSYTMYHFALIREGGTLYFFFDGVELDNDDVTGASFDFSSNEWFALRRHFDNNNGVDGSISEIRFTQGDAVYNTAGFTPPASPLSA